MGASGRWPDLLGEEGLRSAQTLHLWSQLVGKVRLALAPMMNHWWQVPLYVTARGLSTSPIPFEERDFELELDLLSARLELRVSDGARDGFALDSLTVAGFHRRLFEVLRAADLEVTIHPLAVEVPDVIRLDRDDTPRRFDPEWGRRFFTALCSADQLCKEFRARFIGKASPVHFFWGSFDLAVSRFSGRRAPLHPGGAPHCPDRVMHEAYSHEVSSAGFWPGSAEFPHPVFYSYAYPQPPGYAEAPILPAKARWEPALREFILLYEDVRQSATPDRDVRAFLESTYVAAAELGHWPRRELERQPLTEEVRDEGRM